MQNSLPGVIAGHSPHQIVFGRSLVLPGELPREHHGAQKSSTAEAWFELRDSVRKMVHDRMQAVHAA